MPMPAAAVEAYKAKMKIWSYHGPCRVPFCGKEAKKLGVCLAHYNEAKEAPRQGGETQITRMRTLGIVLFACRKGIKFTDPGIRIDVLNLPEHYWFFRSACERIGRKYHKRSPKECCAKWMTRICDFQNEWEAATNYAGEIDWQSFPVEVHNAYRSKTEAELSGIAWRATDTKEGSDARQFVYHLRVIFGCNFSGLGGSGIFHKDDLRDTEDQQAILSPCLEGLFNWEQSRTDDDFFTDGDE